MGMIQAKEQSVQLQPPDLQNAPAIYRLIDECKPLDLNSEYLYMLLSSHFRDTCVIAVMNQEIVAAATAYIIPERPDTLFIWQIAVSAKVRKRGLANKMLKHLLSRRSCRAAVFIEATVTPSNRASRQLFKALALEFKTELQEEEFIESSLFKGSGHEKENLIRVGPIQREVIQ